MKFSDASGPTDSDPRGFTGWTALTNGTAATAINNFFLASSYGQFSVDVTILPVIDLGVASTYYTNICPGTPYPKWTVWGAPGSLADDARKKARDAGVALGTPALYDSANYDLDIIATGYISSQNGAASDGARSVIAFNYFTALPHEISHCLGLQHANGRSRASGYSPVSSSVVPDFYQPYGDVYCLMGWKESTRTANPPPDRDVSPSFKYELGWLTAQSIATPSTSGIYRIHAFDAGPPAPGTHVALRIPRDASYTYWFSYRSAITNSPDAKWSQGGLEVRFGCDNPRATSGVTVLWDTTPGSRGPTGTTFTTMHDAPLQIGRTYSDHEANLHATPLRKGGTIPESLDVALNIGPFPSNQAPTLTLSPSNIILNAGATQVFTAAASDPDGDPVAYYWEFDDNTKSGGLDFGGLAPDATLATQGSHAWAQSGPTFARCTVTDMKGHTFTANATVTVTNGTPAPVTVSGTVKDELGNPLQGAVVNNARGAITYGATNFAGSSETAADGRYRITIPRASTTYVFTAMHEGYSFACSLPGGTVTVANASVTNVNFTRIRATRTLSGGVYIAGHGYMSASNGNLWVSDGTQSVLVTNGTWRLDIPDGTLVNLTATATNPAYTIISDFPKPYRVVNNCDTLSFLVDVPGGMPQAGFPITTTNTDDTVGTVTIPVVLTLPPPFTNWVNDQVFFLEIDPESTASYGVDYTMHQSLITFYGSLAPAPCLIPITIRHDGVPKSKTLILRLQPASSIATLGPHSVFTYTIRNPPTPARITSASVASNTLALSVSNLFGFATNYVLWCEDLMSPHWATAHVITGITGQAPWVEDVTNGVPYRFYRIRSE